MSFAHIFIKPTGVERALGPYDINKGLFRPQPTSLSNACSAWLGHLRRVERDKIMQHALDLAIQHDINILGGAFIAGLAHLGYTEEFVGRFSVNENELAFIRLLYPDLNSREPDVSLAMKIQNNLGSYSVHRVSDPDRADLHFELATLKNRFRECLGIHLATVNLGDCRDHVIHVPDDTDQDRKHCAAAPLS